MLDHNLVNSAPGDSPKSGRAAVAVAIPFALLMVMGLFLPVPHLGRELGVFFDAMHGPAFAAFAALLVFAVPKRTPRQTKLVAVGVWILVVGGGICSEIVQGFLGRSPSWHDVVANSLGAAAGVLWAATRASTSRQVRRRAAAVAVFLLCTAAARAPLVFTDCIIQRTEKPLLASFERPLEMIRWQPHDGKISRVAEYASNGRFAIRMETAEKDYCGIAGRALWFDWSSYKTLAFDATVVETLAAKKSAKSGEVELIVSIQDADHDCRRDDRYERVFRLGPGTHRITIPLAEVAAAPKDRKMDLSRLGLLHFILIDPRHSGVLYLDNVRLIAE